MPNGSKLYKARQPIPPEDQPLVERSTPVDTSVSMTTSAPTDHVCDTQTGATCHMTLTKPAAISHASNEATASMATTADDTPVITVVELHAYDPPATQTYGQHASPLTRSPVPAA
ncbi:hypothetical protein MTO96_026354 [Rhipicephalus appendiculatus]